MFSLLSCESGCAALCWSMSCDKRNAQAIPAGPPPTMTTSAGICGRSTPSTGLRKISMLAVVQSRDFAETEQLLVCSHQCQLQYLRCPGEKAIGGIGMQ